MEAYITTIDEIINGTDAYDMIYEHLRFVTSYPWVKDRMKDAIKKNLESMRSELKVVIETDYIDKVYRDSYYRFFSTKLKGYGRNCVRLSFFEPNFSTKEDFIEAGVDNLQAWYDGFLVLRPLASNACIGRNVIAKRAKREKDIDICTAPVKATCMGAKLNAYGFPHSSQDAEYMSCAETTVWTLLEYFGNKYTLYSPLLPEDVIDSLDATAFERMTPTTGLNFQELSLALKDHGLSTKVYSIHNYLNNPEKFHELFNCYLESGFPLAVCLSSGQGTGHAVVCIGREKMGWNKITGVRRVFENQISQHDYYFWNTHNCRIVFNDDNRPSYKLTDFDTPTAYYGNNDSFKNLKITHFIVPLHCKIYLPAEIAIDASNYLAANLLKKPDGSCVRTFLTSNRSYREYLLTNDDFTTDQKEAYLQIEMPKFVWVTEIADKSANADNKINSIILLDATGNKSGYSDLSSLIFMQNNGTGLVFNENSRKLELFNIKLATEFAPFKGNLK